MVRPPLANDLSSDISWKQVELSSPEVGSSKNITGGLLTNSRAMDSRFLWPPDRLQVSVYVLVVYYLTSQPMELERVSMFVLICVLNSLVAQSLGLLIGAGMNIETGVFLGPVTTIPTILFSGFFVNFDTIPGYLQWVTYVSYVRYGFEGELGYIYL